MEIERIIYGITEDLIQSASEANLGRSLSETELKRLKCIFREDEEFYDALYIAVIEAGRKVMEGKDWDEYDAKYKDTPLENTFY